MQEVKAAKPDLNIDIVGINLIGQEQYNPEMTALFSFPWVQDTTQTNIWAQWKAIKDDLFIVDSLSQQWRLYQLSKHDLTNPTNRAELKQLLLDAATITHGKHDPLPEDWVQLSLGNAPNMPGDDPDSDGRDNFTEYAFGTNPLDRTSAVPIRASLSTSSGKRAVKLLFRRRSGSVLDYSIEISNNLTNWIPVTPLVATVSAPRNLYDGTGTAEVQVTLKPAESNPVQWLRIRAVPRQR